MGTGTSRGKRVAPVGDVHGSRVASSQRDARSLVPVKLRSVLRNARSCAPPDGHSQGGGSEVSGEEEDIDGELDTVLAGYEEQEEPAPAKKTQAKKTFTRSRTYGLCHFSRADTDTDTDSRSAPETEEPRGSRAATTHVNKEDSTRSAVHSSTLPGFVTGGALLEVVPASEQQCTFGGCHSSSLTMPVILYDGSEEELMDTIEREFS